MITTSSINNYIKLILFSSYIICWISISTTFQDIIAAKEMSEFEFKKIFNLVRHVSVYFCLIFAILINFFILIRHNFSFKKNLLFFFLILYFLSQLPGLFLTENSLENFSFIVSSLTIVLIIIASDHFFSFKEKMGFVTISLIILFCVFMISFFPKLFLFLKAESSMYGGVIDYDDFFVGKISPRSSGISRSALIVLILIDIVTYYKNKNRSFVVYFYRAFFITSILVLQSRTILVLTLFYLITLFIINQNFTIKKILKFIFALILTPIFFTFVIFNIHIHNYYLKKNIDSEFNLNLKSMVENSKKPIRLIDEGNFTSGRYEDWNNLLIEFKENKKNIFFGYGAQADRYLINQSASNGILYALSASGLIGLFFYFIFSLLVVFKLLRKIYYLKEDTIYNYLFYLIILIILARSILESSYAVFSIDLIILLTFVNFIRKQNLN